MCIRDRYLKSLTSLPFKKNRNMKKVILLFAIILFFQSNAQIKVLFDATKSEMAGNADWVIDADSKTCLLYTSRCV